MIDLNTACLVQMPYGRRTVESVNIDFNDVFEKLIFPALIRNYWIPMRLDYDDDSSSLLRSAQKILALAPFAIFDITAANPNVLYSLGYRHAWKRGLTLLIQRSGVGLPPFYLASQPYLNYSARLDENDLDTLMAAISKLTDEERARNPSPNEVDIFISYKSEKRDQVAQLADKLRDEGFLVWWDPHLETTSESYSDQIFKALQNAKAVIVCWTQEAFSSKWVVGEASIALEQNKLIQARFDAVQLRPPFNMLQCADLSSFPADGMEFDKIISAVRDLVNCRRLKDA